MADVNLTEKELQKAREEKAKKQKREKEQAEAEAIRQGIYTDLQLDIEQACQKVRELIKDASPTTASVMSGGSTIQCRVKALGKIYRTSACESWIKKADLSQWNPNQFTHLIMELFKLQKLDNFIFKPLFDKAEELAEKRTPSHKLAGRYWSPYHLTFSFTQPIRACLETNPDMYEECVRLTNQIYDKFHTIIYQGNLEQKKREHELRKAVKKLKPTLFEALKAGLTDEDLQTLVDESRVEIVMKS